MIKVQESQVKEMIKAKEVKHALVVPFGEEGFKLTFSAKENASCRSKSGLVLATFRNTNQERVFKTLDAVRRTCKKIGINSFIVCG